MAQLLLVEDDVGISTNLVRALEHEGYACHLAETAAAALSADVPVPDLVLLDVGLPDGDGYQVARSLLATRPGLPIVFLTARAEEIDIVVGLDTGAVDYIVKPFRLAELLARIRAHLRSRLQAPAALEAEGREVLVDGDLRIDVDGRRVRRAGEEIELTAKEHDLLVFLASHAGIVVTRDELMVEVWDSHWHGTTKTLDVHIATLRRKLGEEPGAPSRITTLRGVGYRWEPATERPS